LVLVSLGINYLAGHDCGARELLWVGCCAVDALLLSNRARFWSRSTGCKEENSDFFEGAPKGINLSALFLT